MLAGKIKLFLLSAGGDERITDVVLPGQFFGEVELFSRQPYLAFAEALQPSRYIVIGREIMLRAMEQEPLLAVRMLAQVAMRRVSIEQDLESWCFEGGDCRLMRYLLQENSLERNAVGDTTLRLGLRKGEIAARIGVAPETLSRILREWADDGLITVLGCEITLHPPFFARAEAIAGGAPEADFRAPRTVAAGG
jgi:CRP/FNR family transcriptional regulator